MPTIHELIRDDVSLEVECVDRLYLNGYVPRLQMPGQLVNFLMYQRGHTIPSPALLGKMTDGFRNIPSSSSIYIQQACGQALRPSW
jgi:hypothetical protein